MAHTYCLTRFTVSNKYKELYNNEGKLEWVTFDNESLSDLKFKSDLIYNPLEDTKELYTELNKVRPIEPKSLLKFINTYGLINGLNIDEGNEDIKAIYRMSMKSFYEHWVPFKQIIFVWEAIKENNVNELEKYKDEFRLLAASRQLKTPTQNVDEIKSILKYSLSKQEHPLAADSFKTWIQVKDEDLRIIAKAYISVLLNQQSTGQIKTTLIDIPCNKNGKTIFKKELVEAVFFKDLFEVAFYQLREAILNKDIRKCEHCGFPFEVTHERQRFCPPLFGRKRSTCENTFNQRLKRKRMKEKKQE